jgi:hypothetical protein
MDSGYNSCTQPSWKAPNFELVFLKRSCVLSIQVLLTSSILFSLKLLVEQNPRPPSVQTDGKVGFEDLAEVI